MRIYLIRHGETDWNRAMRLQGREDIPLNETGKEQAAKCGEAIRTLDVDLIVASPLSRAKDTASIIGEQIGIGHVELDDDLIERDFGVASGLTYQERNIRYQDKQIPGFEEKEKIVDRMTNALKRYSIKYPEGHVLMISHGGVINAMISHITEEQLGSGKTRLKNACVTILDVKENQVTLVDYNLEPVEFADRYLGKEE